MNPNTTCTPARSICRAQVMLFASSKTRLQLDERRHMFTVLSRLDQSTHDGAIATRTVERLLDGQNLWIDGCSLDEFDDRLE